MNMCPRGCVLWEMYESTVSLAVLVCRGFYLEHLMVLYVILVIKDKYFSQKPSLKSKPPTLSNAKPKIQ